MERTVWSSTSTTSPSSTAGERLTSSLALSHVVEVNIVCLNRNVPLAPMSFLLGYLFDISLSAGYQLTSAECFDLRSGRVVVDQYCHYYPENIKPKPKLQECNMEPCLARLESRLLVGLKWAEDLILAVISYKLKRGQQISMANFCFLPRDSIFSMQMVIICQQLFA